MGGEKIGGSWGMRKYTEIDILRGDVIPKKENKVNKLSN